MKDVKLVNNISEANAVTHAGSFHADEVMATAILAQFMDVNVIRTLNVPKELPENILVYDIGEGKYDHHQKGGNGKRSYSNTPYASAGLIWKDFYKEVLKNYDCPSELVDDVMLDVDKTLIECIDGSDNGVKPFAGKSFYRVKSVYQIIGNFNPLWYETGMEDKRFKDAVMFTGTILENAINVAIAKYKAKELVENAIEKTDSKTIILDCYMPWEEHVLGSKLDKAKDIWYVIYPSKRGGYSVQCVPDKIGSFGQRHSLPKKWHGLRGAELRKEIEIPDAIFVHSTGFMGSCESLDGAKLMAEKAEKNKE